MFLKRAFQYFVVIPLITLVFLEIGLQAVALFLDANRAENQSLKSESLRIVSIGDSNTFGLYLPKEESYPYQLEVKWNKEHGTYIQVLNLGYPGINSTQVRRNLPAIIQNFQPNIILLCVGVNDWWSDPNLDLLKEDGDSFNFFKKLRLYKLYYMLKRIKLNKDVVRADGYFLQREGFNPRLFGDFVNKMNNGGDDANFEYDEFQFEAKVSLPTQKQSSEFLEANYLDNMKFMNKLAMDNGTKLFLLTYASKEALYGHTNILIRRLATEIGIPLIDIEKSVYETCTPLGNCADLFFPDRHPNAKGYSLVADTIITNLRE